MLPAAVIVVSTFTLGAAGKQVIANHSAIPILSLVARASVIRMHILAVSKPACSTAAQRETPLYARSAAGLPVQQKYRCPVPAVAPESAVGALGIGDAGRG